MLDIYIRKHDCFVLKSVEKIQISFKMVHLFFTLLLLFDVALSVQRKVNMPKIAGIIGIKSVNMQKLLSGIN